jgi:hypothetical protein
MQIDGKYAPPITYRYGGRALEFTIRTMVIALLKPLAIIVVIVLLIYFGAPQLAKLLRPG